jgi:N-acyl homoserine lactone hydrolase
MLACKVDGVSADETIATATLRATRHFAREQPVVYLPTHDPESAVRLTGTMKAFRQVVVEERS